VASNTAGVIDPKNFLLISFSNLLFLIGPFCKSIIATFWEIRLVFFYMKFTMPVHSSTKFFQFTYAAATI